MSPLDFMIELQGTPDEVQEMLNKASRIEGATAYKKKRISEDVYHVWYRGKGAPNDLIAAIKKAAGLTKPKRTSRGRKRGGKVESGVVHQVGESVPHELEQITFEGEPELIEELDDGGASPGSPETTA